MFHVKHFEGMKYGLIVGLGGFFGSVGRFAVGRMMILKFPNAQMPWGTIAVNVSGCFVAGLLGGIAESKDVWSHEMRLLLFTGILGGFTTFSAFGLETILLLRKSEMMLAGANVLLNLVGCLAAAWLGFKISS